VGLRPTSIMIEVGWLGGLRPVSITPKKLASPVERRQTEQNPPKS